MQELVERCGNIAKSKGFKLNQHALQVSLIATEVVEALEELIIPHDADPHLRLFVKDLSKACANFEWYRKDVSNKSAVYDGAEIVNRGALLEELSDVCIRVF